MISRYWFFLLCMPAVAFTKNCTTEVRAGYFYPFSQTMRDIYRSGGIEYEVEGAVAFSKYWNAWVNANYFHRKGRSLGEGDKTSIRVLPLSLGIKFHHQIYDKLQFYLGIGGSYTWVTLHDHSNYVKKHGSKQGWGVVGKSGFTHSFGKYFFLDLFADYYYTKVSGEHSHHVVRATGQDIGGLRTGLGLGIAY